MHIEVIKWLVDDRPLLKSIFRFFAALLTVSYVQYSAHKSAGLSITYTNATPAYKRTQAQAQANANANVTSLITYKYAERFPLYLKMKLNRWNWRSEREKIDINDGANKEAIQQKHTQKPAQNNG